MWDLRVLQVGIRAMSPHKNLVVFLVVCDMYESNVDTCSVVLGGSEQSGGEARCFKYNGAGQVEASLDEEAVVMVVSSKVESDVGVGNLPIMSEFPWSYNFEK
jgi:hypothetical protein